MRHSLGLAGGVAAICLTAMSFSATAASAGDMTPTPAGDYPPGAQPGECFAKVLVPEVAETTSERVLVSPERTISRVVAGQCAWQEKTDVVRPASVELINRPATYRTVTESVVVHPGGYREETIAPVYEMVTEQVLVRAGYRTWRPGRAAVGYSVSPGAADGSESEVLPTGEVLCLVEVPPEYQTITRQVLKTPAHVVQVPYPAEMGLVSRQVIDSPAHTEKRDIPAETRLVKAKICAPDQTVSETVPAEYRMVSNRRLISPAHYEWRKVDCKADVVHPLAPLPPAPIRRVHPPHRRHNCGCEPKKPPPPSPAPPCAATRACVRPAR